MTKDGTLQDAARRALLDIERYLADEIAPFQAAEAFGVLLRLSPTLGAKAIEHWLEVQLRTPAPDATVGGYLYHAVKKLQLLAELELLERGAVDRYLSELTRLIVRMCPDPERAELTLRLGRLGEVETTLSAPVRLLNRERGTEEFEQEVQRSPRGREWAPERGKAPRTESPRPTAPDGGVGDAGATQRRLNVLLRELHRRQEGSSLETLAHLVSKAAVEARSGQQLEAFLERVPGTGVGTKFDRRMFRILGDGLPGWELDRAPAPGVAATLGRVLQAMHRIVSLAGTPEEGIERFGAMVYAAIEKLNEGHLAQAVAMLDVAERLIEEKKIDRETAQSVRERAQGSVSPESLRRLAANPAKHGLLRKVLRFFPVFFPESLLERLDGEPRRDTRKLLLVLLEVHGPPCRSKILDRLVRYLSGQLPDPSGFYSRNAVFLLRRIPPGAGRDRERELERELDMLTELCRPGRPFLVVREALGAVAQDVGLPHAEKVLAERLVSFEQEALGTNATYRPEEAAELLDRTCAALSRLGTPVAIRGVVRHAFRREARLGDARSRLRHLSACNVAADPETLLELQSALKATLPVRVLGIVLPGGDADPRILVRALSGTDHPLVLRLFEEIVARFPGRDFAEEAREALNKLRSGSPSESAPAQAILGDLDVFGLPNLFQSLSDGESTGCLFLFERNGADRGVVFFAGGKISGCEVGRLRGLDAACQLFERPREGTFRFESMSLEQIPRPTGEPLEVLATVLEAIRRHDELQGDSALVPDGTSLAPTATAPELPAEEEDREFVRQVWREASTGTAPESCEGRVRGDAYRVRRLYAHWFEQGALQKCRAA